MKGKRSKYRLICLFIILSLIFSLFIGCGGSENESVEGSPEKEDKEQTSPGKEEDKKDKEDKSDYVLTVTTMDRYVQWSQDDMREIFVHLQDKTGIKFKFECVPGDQYSEVMTVRLASNEKLPDLLTLPGGATEILRYMEEGVIIPLQDLIEDHGTNIKKYFDENPTVRASHYTPEGDVPVFYADTKDYHNFAPDWPWVRTGYLDKIGMDMPETIDDFYDMLVAFKHQDMNEDGDANNEIPLSCQSWSHLFRFGQMFGSRVAGDGFNPNADGEIEYHFINDRFKESLIFLNKLYKEGLLDSEFSTMKSDILRTKISNGIVCAFVGYAHGNPALIQAGITDNEDRFLYLPVLENSYGEREWVGSHGLGTYPLGITKDCKDPELAIKWIDEYCFNRENYVHYILGIEGKNYTLENGKYKATEWAENHPEANNMEDVVKTMGGTPALPYPYDIEAWKLIFQEGVDAGTRHKDETAVSVENQKYVVDPFPYLYADEKDTETVNKYLADINTYRDEMFVKFIIGEEPIDKFEQYIDKMNSMGVPEIIEIKQRQYDEYVKLLNEN